MSKHDEDATSRRRKDDDEAQQLPEGWYYYGKQPPWAGQSAPREDPASDLKQAFDKVSRGNVDADTLGKLFALDDRHFWKGALVGAGVVLAMSNLPAIKGFMTMAMAGAGDMMRSPAPRREPSPAYQAQQEASPEEKRS